MGFIAQFGTKSFTRPGHRGESTSFPGAGIGRALWRTTFGDQARNKEDPHKPRSRGNQGRSVAGANAAVSRLVQALRSMAPGGWSDDRWEQTKHWEGIQYIAGHRICELLYQGEFQVFKKDENNPDGKRPVSKRKDPEAYKLAELLEKPNPQDSFGDMMYRWFQQMTLTGKALTWMVPNKLGTPYELYPIPTAIAIPQAAINPEFPDGYYRIQPVYPYGPFSSYPTPSTSVGAPIPAQWMMDFKYPHPLLRYDGYAPMTALRLHIDELTMMDRSRHYAMRRQIRPSAKLTFKELENAEQLPEAEIDRLIAQIENAFQGPENAGALFVAPPGSDLEEWGTSPREMDYASSWDQLVNFIMGGLGITKPAAGMVEDSSYSTLFATLKQLYWLSIDPCCSRFAHGLTRHLAPFFGDDLVIEIRAKRLDDHDIAFQKISKLGELVGKPKSMIRVCLKLLDMPLDEELIKELSEAGQEQQQPGAEGGMPGMEGAPGAAPGAEGEQPPMEQAMQAMGGAGEEGALGPRDEEQEVEASRPTPGPLSEGALGPRKRLGKYFTKHLPRVKHLKGKSFYERVKEMCGNGH